jgi:hypothetical protein
MKLIPKLYLFVFTLVIGHFVTAQTNSPYLTETKLVIESVDKKGNAFNAYTNNSYMLLNTATGDFLLSFDVADLKTGKPKLDSVLISKGPQKIIFKGNISENLFVFNQQVNNEKLYDMPGQLIINNTAIDCVASFDPLNYGEKSNTKNYRMDFKLEIDADKISILGLEKKIKNQFVIEVKSGTINTQQ